MSEVSESEAASASGPVDDESDARTRRPTPLAVRIITWVVFAVVMLVVAFALVIPRIIGAVPLAVLTSSMEPTLPPGTLVISKPTDPEHLAVGDVVTFQPFSDDPMLVTHRIIAMGIQTDGDYTFTTRGDNNGIDDEPIIGDQVMGKVIYSIPFVGYATSLFDNRERGWVVIVIGGLLIGYAVFTIVFELLRRRRR